MYQLNIRKIITLVWFQVLLSVLILSSFRQVFTYLIGDTSQIFNLFEDYIQSIVIGLRFDLRVATIVFAPIFILGLVLSRVISFIKFRKIIIGYSAFIYFLLITSSIANYFYYTTYSNHFDIFIFGLIDDDTKSVIITMWEDYPILPILLISIIIALTTTKLTNHFYIKVSKRRLVNRPRFNNIIYILSTIIVYFILARGSIGTFPLKQYHANVSNYEVLNKVTPNSLMAIDWARSNRNKSVNFHPIDKEQYTSKIKTILGKTTPTYTTEKNLYLEANQPNVVFALMEGMGTNLLVEDREVSNDLLGEFRQHYKNDFTFNRFLPGSGATIDSIAMMLFHSNVSTISHGTAQKLKLPDSAFIPYKKSGYKVIYITGGSPTWRNLKYYLPLQGVDEFYSEEDINRAFPESLNYPNPWGVVDEFTFKFAEKILLENEQPVVMMIQTQTNHPPYQIPDNYNPAPISVSQHAMNKMSLNEEKSKKIYETYQYAANSLGDFITKIKKSKLGENTIISASGDHRLRNYSISYPEDLATALSVPFYLHIPGSILNNTRHLYESARIGSHKDIFPTLYAYSLSDTEYTSLGGRNLLAIRDIEKPFAYSTGVTFTSEGATYSSNINLLNPWSDATSLILNEHQIPNSNPNIASDYYLLQTLYINSRVKGYISN